MIDLMFAQVSFVDVFNFCVFIVFTCCYAYQLFYVFVTLTRRPPKHISQVDHKFAVLISARNESAVIVSSNITAMKATRRTSCSMPTTCSTSTISAR